MFEDCEYTDKIIINDRSPFIFKHVLGFLISNSYPYPKKYEAELKYYLIDYDVNKLYDPLCKITKDIETINKCISIDIETDIVKINKNVNYLKSSVGLIIDKQDQDMKLTKMVYTQGKSTKNCNKGSKRCSK